MTGCDKTGGSTERREPPGYVALSGVDECCRGVVEHPGAKRLSGRIASETSFEKPVHVLLVHISVPSYHSSFIGS
jgi:hypothetical protein